VQKFAKNKKEKEKRDVVYNAESKNKPPRSKLDSYYLLTLFPLLCYAFAIFLIKGFHYLLKVTNEP